MTYAYKVILVGDENVRYEDQIRYEVECKNAQEATDIINNHFGLPVTSRDSVYNYFNRRHLCSKKVFGKFVFLERHQLKPKKKKKCKTSSAPECSHPAACQ